MVWYRFFKKNKEPRLQISKFVSSSDDENDDDDEKSTIEIE